MARDKGYVCSIMQVPGHLNPGLGVPNLDIGYQAGLNFIIVQHERQTGRTRMDMDGFQGVSVNVDQRKGNEKIWFQVDKDRREMTKDVASGYKLKFFPTGIMNILMAAIPDTKFNRRVLALDNGQSCRVHKTENDNYAEIMADLTRIRLEEGIVPNKSKQNVDKGPSKPKDITKISEALCATDEKDLAEKLLDPKYDHLKGVAKDLAKKEFAKELDAKVDELKEKGSKNPHSTSEYKLFLGEAVNLIFQRLVADAAAKG